MACVPMLAISPFFKGHIDYEKLISQKRRNGFDDRAKKIRPEFTIMNPNHPRFMHFDLSENRDTVGFAMSHCPYFVERYRLVRKKGTKELEPQIMNVPFIVFDLIGRVEVSKKEELDYNMILDIIFVSAERGANIHLITFDRFQSSTLRQLLKEQGFVTANLSIDRTAYKIVLDNDPKIFARSGQPLRRVTTEQSYSAAMQALKDVIDEVRCEIPFDRMVPEGEIFKKVDGVSGQYVKNYLKHELEGAEYDGKKDKVDHSKRSSIDMLQGMAGACFCCINNSHDVDISEDQYNSETVDNFMAEQDRPDAVRAETGVDTFNQDYNTQYPTGNEVLGL